MFSFAVSLLTMKRSMNRSRSSSRTYGEQYGFEEVMTRFAEYDLNGVPVVTSVVRDETTASYEPRKSRWPILLLNDVAVVTAWPVFEKFERSSTLVPAGNLTTKLGINALTL